MHDKTLLSGNFDILLAKYCQDIINSLIYFFRFGICVT